MRVRHTQIIERTNVYGQSSLSAPYIRSFCGQQSNVASCHGSAMSAGIIHCRKSYYTRNRPRKPWKNNIKEWTDQSVSPLVRIADDISRWAAIRAEASVGVPQRRLSVTRISRHDISGWVGLVIKAIHQLQQLEHKINLANLITALWHPGVVDASMMIASRRLLSSAMHSSDDHDWSVHSLMLSSHDLRGLILQHQPSTVYCSSCSERIVSADIAERTTVIWLAMLYGWQ